MTKKQITTLILFAQNYSLQVIAKKQRVSLATIRERIKSLSKNHYKEFNNALAIQEVYKRNRDALRSTQNFSSLFNRTDLIGMNTIPSTDDITKRVREVF